MGIKFFDGSKTVDVETLTFTKGKTIIKRLLTEYYVEGQKIYENPFSFESNADGTYSANSYLTSTVPDRVIVPGSYQGVPVTKLTAVCYNKDFSSIVIPESILRIGEDTFSHCRSLTDVFYKGTKEQWETIYIDSIGTIYLRGATRWYYSETPPTDVGNYWHYSNGEITKWPTVELLQFININNAAYSVRASLGATLPEIVIIPAEYSGLPVTQVVDYGFQDQPSRIIILPDSIKTISSSAFLNCDNIKFLYIPNGVTTINTNTFKGCSALESVYLPASFNKMQASAFNECTSLKKIYFGGTKEQWAAISIDNTPSTYFSNAKVYYYSETQPTADGDYWKSIEFSAELGDYVIKEWGACDHTMTAWTTTKEANCTAAGERARSCTECGHTETETISALGHDWGEWTVTLEPTCTTEGNKRRTCKRDGCTSFQDTTISATGHTPSDWIIDKNANGSEDGSRHKVCTVCGTVLETEIIPAPYKPTATSYFTFTLLEDDTYSIAAKDATNMPTNVFLPTEYNGKAVTVIGKHAFMDCTDIEYVFIPSSITTIGYGAFAYCYNLGTAWIPHTVTTVDWGVFSYTGTAVYIDIHYPPYPPTGWNEDWDIYLPEGAVHWGVSFSEMFNTSLLSDATYEVTATETALANEYIYIPDSHEGTDITSIGASAFAGSSATGVRIGDNITLIGKLAFSGAKMHMIKLPLKVDTIKPLAFSNMPEGTVIYCEANSKPNGWADDWCDDSVTVVWGDGCAAGHSYKSVVTPPTCTTKGYTTHTCEECGDSYVDSYTDPTGVHNWSAWEETKAPQCTTEGEEKRTCSVCGATETRAIEATGHHYSVSDEVDSTCTEKGYIEYTCDECLADSYRVEKDLDPDNHDWDVEVEVVKPTCTEQGYTIHTCNACGETYKDNYTDMISHTYDLTLVEPTCTEQGYVDHICKDCGHSYKDAYTEALGHSPSDWIIDKEATVEAEGSKHKECTRCGVTLETATIPKVDDSIYLVTEAGEYLTDEQGNLLIL